MTSWLAVGYLNSDNAPLYFWMAVSGFLLFKNRKLALLTFFASAWFIVPVRNMIDTVIDYRTGKATYMSAGMPQPEFYNLDETYRVWNTTSGCIVSGREWMTHSPNNYTIRFLTNVFGIQNGVYKGYYPDKITTGKMLDSVLITVPYLRITDGFTFKKDGNNYSIRDIEYNAGDTTDLNAKVIIYKNELIIFKPNDTKFGSITYLADISDGKVFAKYYKY